MLVVRRCCLFVLGLAVSACGAPAPTTTSCSGMNGAQGVCIEYYGTSPPSASECNGTYADMACTRTGAAGGCRTTQSSGTFTTWYYGTTTSMVQMLCGLAGETFVAP